MIFNLSKNVRKSKADVHREFKDQNNVEFLRELKKIDPKCHASLKDQDEQIESIQKAETQYENDHDVEKLIVF